jgi:hypothetical protein
MYSGRSGFGDLPVSFKFSNQSGGSNTVFKSGESWLVEITGPSNQPVWLVAQGGVPIQMGQTDTNGRYARTGTVGDGEIGNWYETWYIGGSTGGGSTLFNGTMAGSISFAVVAIPKPPSSPVTPPPPPLPSGGGSFQFPDVSARQWSDVGTTWMLWAGAGLAALFLLKGKR